MRSNNNNSNNRRSNKKRTNTKKQKRVITDYIDYKDGKKLIKYISDQGKIIPRRITGLTAKQHRELVRAIKRARQVAILPFVSEAVK
ncbi:MAG: 30S ribosomal protein S18 [Ignavibacteriae bacterium]|nr:30S ribosomal protein S18 [Ignavibacteriota bacterium]